MPPRMIRQIVYGSASERPTVGKSGDLFVIHSDSEGTPVSPTLCIYNAYANDWVEVKASSLALLEDPPSAGTATASKGVLLDASKEIDTWNFVDSYQMGGITHTFQDHTIKVAEMLALNATPRHITDAPAATSTLIFEGAWLYKPAGTAYAAIHANDDLTITYDAAGAEVGRIEATGFLDQTGAEVRFAPPLRDAVATIQDHTSLAGLCLEMGMLNGEVTTGDSELYVRTFYAVVPVLA